MLEAVGLPVRHLHRSAYAGLTLDGLEPGEWRELTRGEIERLRPIASARHPGEAATHEQSPHVLRRRRQAAPRTNPMRSYIAASVGARLLTRLVGAGASRRASSAGSPRSSSVALLDRVEQLDDRFRHARP